jgi:hypothetical protein
MIPNSSPLLSWVGRCCLPTKENWRKILLLWTLLSIIKLEACDHVEEITKGVGGNVLQANVEIEWISPKRKKKFAAENIPFLTLKP